jgi:hypothetical protein
MAEEWNMEIRKPRWLLLATVLSFAGSFGCSSDAPSDPDQGGDDDTDTTESPAGGDDDADDTTADDDSGDDDDDTPVLDAGGKPPNGGGGKDAGGNPPKPGNDAGNGGGRDSGGGSSGSDAGSGGKDAEAPTGGDDGGSTTPGGGAGAGSCGPEITTAAAELGDIKKPGPWKPARVERTGPSGSSWVVYPEGFGKDGMKHPVFQWGPGAGTNPVDYVDHLSLLASHGFVIISQSSQQSGKGALDWILKQNETQGSMWFGKIDTNRVGRGGHSMGALQSMSQADDDRLKLTVLVCGGAGGGGGAANIDYPSIFLGGGTDIGTPRFSGDFAEVKGPSVFVTHSTSGHIPCARDNLGPWVAFMRWQFCGEEAKWKKEFMPGGTYCKAPWDACKTKNL